MAGYCRIISVEIHKDGSLSVDDDGRGIPVDTVKATGKSALETVLTVLHAGVNSEEEVQGFWRFARGRGFCCECAFYSFACGSAS